MSNLVTVPVAIKKTGYLNPQIDKLLMPLGGMGSYIRMGENVLLKINLLSARAPYEAVTTHPEFVRAIAREVKKAGGLPYIGDSPAGTFSERVLIKAYEKSGIMAMAKEEDIPLNFDTGSEKVIIPNGIKIKKIQICNYLLKADKISCIPKLKTHSLQYLTLACKNMYGAVPGLIKAKYHAIFPGKMAFADMLLDIYSFTNPSLFIMDAVLGLHGEGPAGNGDPIEIGLALCLGRWDSNGHLRLQPFGYKPASIPLLKRAKIRGMWPQAIKYPILSRMKTGSMDSGSCTASYLLTGKEAD